eukprot:5117176-Prymnesium_polylepis.2
MLSTSALRGDRSGAGVIDQWLSVQSSAESPCRALLTASCFTLTCHNDIAIDPSPHQRTVDTSHRAPRENRAQQHTHDIHARIKPHVRATAAMG